MKKRSRLIVLAVLLAPAVGAQQPVAPTPTPAPTQAENQGTTIRAQSNYVLGPGDQIAIRAFQVDEISDRPFRIDTEGNINLPVLGTVKAGGLTVEQLEADLLQRLKALVKNPQVSVNVVQFRSEPIFLEGAFKTPGIYTLQGRDTLLQMITSSGGLLPNASRRITVTRHLEYGKIPLTEAVVDRDKNVSTAEISIASLRDNINPAEDIKLQPFDVISADRAEMIYVSGEVNRAGAFELGERESISVAQLIAMSGGMAKDADPAKARVLRPVLSTSRRAEIPVNIKRILAGQQSDFPLLPNDVLYIPKSRKLNLDSAALILVPIASGMVYVLASKL